MPAGEPSQTDDVFQWVGASIEGKYFIERVVGAGGFGVVYQAQHRTLGPVAIKCLKVHVRDDQRGRFHEQFVAEGKLLRNLSAASTGIVQAFDAGETTSPSGLWCPYLVLEWLQGRTLADDLAERRSRGVTRNLREAIALLEPVARALDVAHGQGVAHRDIKPENLFIANIGGSWTIKVLDFGIAKVMGDAATLTVGSAKTGFAVRAFSLRHAAPEHFNPSLGATGPWTDVYALALVLIEVVAGRSPYVATKHQDLAAEALDHERRPSFSRRGLSVPPDVDRVMRSALAVDPRNRPSRAGAFWRELTAALLEDQIPDTSKPQTEPEPAQGPTTVHAAAQPTVFPSQAQLSDSRPPAPPLTPPTSHALSSPEHPLASSTTTTPLTRVMTTSKSLSSHPYAHSTAPPKSPDGRRRFRYRLVATALAIMASGIVGVGFAIDFWVRELNPPVTPNPQRTDRSAISSGPTSPPPVETPAETIPSGPTSTSARPVTTSTQATRLRLFPPSESSQGTVEPQPPKPNKEDTSKFWRMTFATEAGRQFNISVIGDGMNDLDCAIDSPTKGLLWLDRTPNKNCSFPFVALTTGSYQLIVGNWGSTRTSFSVLITNRQQP